MYANGAWDRISPARGHLTTYSLFYPRLSTPDQILLYRLAQAAESAYGERAVNIYNCSVYDAPCFRGFSGRALGCTATVSLLIRMDRMLESMLNAELASIRGVVID